MNTGLAIFRAYPALWEFLRQRVAKMGSKKEIATARGKNREIDGCRAIDQSRADGTHETIYTEKRGVTSLFFSLGTI